MSINGDLLTAATPTRLVCRRGSWSLEVERLVAVERDVYQPRTQRLEGTDLVLQHLQRVENTALARAASALIRSLQAAEECAFEALDSEWIACDARPRGDSSRPNALAAANATVLELRAELCLLRATQAGLRERLARLEAQLASQARLRELRAPQSLAPTREAHSSGASPIPVAPAAVIISAASLPPPSLIPAPVPPSPSTPAPHAASPLQLPSSSAVAACLKTLIGKKIGVREAQRGNFPAKGTQLYWFSRLLDDEGNDVGALVTDLAGAIGLGGALMMIPPSQLDAQRAAQTPSEDVMCAMAEVMNNLSATINQMPDALHVRVQALEAMTEGNLAWTKSAAQAMDLELEDGMGHLLLFAR